MNSVFVTGAAAGIGRAIAERFGRAGWFVGVYDVDERGARELQGTLPRSHAGPLDVTSPEQWKERLAEFVASAGRLDLLVNNAGIAVTAPFVETDLARHHRLIDVNVKGVINGCHLAFEHLKRTPDARVVNLCSASAFFGQPLLATYSASKAAVRSLTESLDLEWSPHGVRVVDVMPMFVDTAMVRDEVSKTKAVARLGVRLTADDVASVIEDLARRPARDLPVHTPVGRQAALLRLASKLSPDAWTRFVTGRFAS